jgi:hypothetical protein
VGTIITVFGSGRTAPGSADYQTAEQLGAALARAGFGVATGGYGGAMEAVSRGARAAGGKVIGVTTEVFSSPANPWVEQELRMKTWHERLLKLVELGAGYVALAGGTGTLVELAVVWEWVNKGFLPARPLVLLGEFWVPVVETIPAREYTSSPILRAASAEEAVQILIERLGDPRGATSLR